VNILMGEWLIKTDFISVADPTSAQWPLFEGLTCVPPSLRSEATSCTLGGYASYSINVTNVAQIQLGLNFARSLNLRLVVRSSGHDFADKSVGAGALSLWTRNLKDLEFVPNYVYGSYSGPAFKLGAGVETADVYAAAEQNNVTVVGGECRVSCQCLMGNEAPRKLILARRLLVSQEATSLEADILHCQV
jgi:hypothetical protein